jgi:hypothetical protein
MKIIPIIQQNTQPCGLCTANPHLFGNRREAEAKIALKLRRSAICTVLDEVGTDIRKHGVGFLVTFLPTKKVTESVLFFAEAKIFA